MYIIKGFKKNSGTLKNGKPWDNYHNSFFFFFFFLCCCWLSTYC